MVGVLRNFLPGVSSPHKVEEDDDDDDPNNVEYSFAIEYSGPPVMSNIPRVVPVDVNQIPIAVTVVSASLLSEVPLPVIQPIVSSNFSNKKLSKEEKLGSNGLVGEWTNGVLNGNCRLCESSSNGVDKSRSLCCESGVDYGTMSSDRIGSSGIMCGASSDMPTPKLSNGIESSGRLGFYEGCVGCPESSGRVLESPDHSREDARGEFEDYMNSIHCEIIESESSSSHSNSSEIFSGQDEDHIEEVPRHVKRPSAVTFRDPDSNDVLEEEESDVSVAESSTPARSYFPRPGKKGTCYRCLKGNKFTEKEACIVCGAKYCYTCLLRAMGSMPEGRKCISCIGQRIDEAYRKNLGRSSRMLKQLLRRPEIKRIMNSEKSCAMNQLPPELIYVNHERLSQQELSDLQSCPNPPGKLKPGHYWYDKVSGLWGKEGEKPCQIISPQLDIGGHIWPDASNGTTNVMINNRRITKGELLMLKFAGVKCEGATHFWVSSDGSYQEEGMNNVKGKIWKNYRTKLICVALRLPSPPDTASSSVEVNGVMPKEFEEKRLHKLLLVGCEKSGTSTIFKQAKIVYKVPFSEDERESIKSIIQCNLYGYLGILLEWRERFEAESLIGKRRRFVNHCGPSSSADNTAQIDCKSTYSISLKLKSFSDWLLQVMMAGNLESMIPAASREYAPLVEELWKDAAIQATYNRRHEIDSLPRVATYFLERAVEISRVDYKPSDMDILYAEGITSSKGLSYMEFAFPKSTKDNCEPIGYGHDPSLRYQLIRAHPRTLGGNCKWLEMFEDVNIVLSCVSLIDYDESCKSSTGVPTNKMMASKQLFENIVTHPTFKDKKFLLILNKFDLLEEKIEQVPLAACEWFQDFRPVMGNNPTGNGSTNTSLAHRAFQFIAMKFKTLFNSLTDMKLYVSLATGLEPDNVDEALRYAREILKWEQEEHSFHNVEMSSTSIEASSSC